MADTESSPRIPRAGATSIVVQSAMACIILLDSEGCTSGCQRIAKWNINTMNQVTCGIKGSGRVNVQECGKEEAKEYLKPSIAVRLSVTRRHL